MRAFHFAPQNRPSQNSNNLVILPSSVTIASTGTHWTSIVARGSRWFCWTFATGRDGSALGFAPALGRIIRLSGNSRKKTASAAGPRQTGRTKSSQDRGRRSSSYCVLV